MVKSHVLAYSKHSASVRRFEGSMMMGSTGVSSHPGASGMSGSGVPFGDADRCIIGWIEARTDGWMDAYREGWRNEWTNERTIRTGRVHAILAGDSLFNHQVVVNKA